MPPLVDGDSFYDVLGVQPSASADEITQAYKKLSKKHHPDRKGGNKEKFQELQKAHSALSDPDKRARYDRFGEEGLEGGPQDDLLSQLFRTNAAPERRKGPTTKYTLDVSLEEIFSGATRKLKLTKKTIDQAKVTKCEKCNGQGAVMQQVRTPMGEMMTQAACPSCHGEGFQCSSRNESTVVEVVVPKGAPDGHKIVFHGKGDDIPHGEAGDLVVLLKEKPHPEFKRHGADLYVTREISLVEALTGFAFDLVKLDGRTLVVKSTAGQITAPSLFNPFTQGGSDDTWEAIPDTGCSLPAMAQANSDDVPMLQQAVSKGQLEGRGIGCFVVKDGRATFMRGTREECLDAKSAAPGSTMYVLADPAKAAAGRLMHAVKGEGLPTMQDPSQCGNLFVQIKIDFPSELSEEAVQVLKNVLPPPLHSSEADEASENVDVGEVVLKDPVVSHREGVISMGDASREDEEMDAPAGCAQM